MTITSLTRLTGMAAAAAFAGFLTVAPVSAQETVHTFNASLAGGSAGDSDGTGMFSAEWDSAAGQLCYRIEVADIEPATAAHIHRGSSGEEGPPVITLDAPSQGEVESCVSVDAEVANELVSNPAGFYVNVHNDEFSEGAIRGQLETAATP